MTKRWSSTRSDLTQTKHQASKLEREDGKRMCHMDSPERKAWQRAQNQLLRSFLQAERSEGGSPNTLDKLGGGE